MCSVIHYNRILYSYLMYFIILGLVLGCPPSLRVQLGLTLHFSFFNFLFFLILILVKQHCLSALEICWIFQI